MGQRGDKEGRINQIGSEEDGMRKEGAKEGKLGDDHSENGVDPSGGPLLEAPSRFLSLSVSRALSLVLVPPFFPPAAVSLLINFSPLTRALSCSSPQPASETALRSALPLPHSYSSSNLHICTGFGFKSVLKV